MTGRELDDYFAAVTEATEEAVLNSLLEAVTVTGRDGHTSSALPASDLRRPAHGDAAVMPDSLPPAAPATPAADDPYGWMRDTQLPAMRAISRCRTPVLRAISSRRCAGCGMSCARR